MNINIIKILKSISVVIVFVLVTTIIGFVMSAILSRSAPSIVLFVVLFMSVMITGTIMPRVRKLLEDFEKNDKFVFDIYKNVENNELYHKVVVKYLLTGRKITTIYNIYELEKMETKINELKNDKSYLNKKKWEKVKF